MRIPVHQLPHGLGLDLPAAATPHAAGMDLRAAIPEGETWEIAPGQRRLVPTGLVLALPRGFEGQVRPRSGLALRHGLTVLNAPGTIDADYRGEVQVLLINHGETPPSGCAGASASPSSSWPPWKAGPGFPSPARRPWATRNGAAGATAAPGADKGLEFELEQL